MTAKKSLGWQNHQDAVRLHGKIEDRCDQGIAGAIRNAHAQIDAHYVAARPGLYLKSILPIVRANVDAPVKEWMAKIGQEPASYSSILEQRKEYCAEYFERIAESIANSDPYGYSLRYPDLDRTTDTLIVFCYYCLAHRSNNIQALKVEPEEKNPNIIGVHPTRGKRSAGTARRLEQLGITTEIDFTNLSDEQSYCQLCTDLSMHTRELMRLLFNSSSDCQISNEDRRTLATTDLHIVMPKFKRHYCVKHDPDDEPATAYNRAHARRKFTIRCAATLFWHVMHVT